MAHNGLNQHPFVGVRIKTPQNNHLEVLDLGNWHITFLWLNTEKKGEIFRQILDVPTAHFIMGFGTGNHIFNSSIGVPG